MTTGHGIETIRIARHTTARPVPSLRRLAGIITGAAMALSLVLATSLPARADSKGDTLAKALIAALIVGAIIHETKRDKPPAPALPPEPKPVHKKKKKPDATPRIPGVCALEFEGESRSVTVYPESCLLDAGVPPPLPRHCAKRARIFGDWDRIYSENCLRDGGFLLPKRAYEH